jgi:hypothetical protein
MFDVPFSVFYIEGQFINHTFRFANFINIQPREFILTNNSNSSWYEIPEDYSNMILGYWNETMKIPALENLSKNHSEFPEVMREYGKVHLVHPVLKLIINDI